MSPPPLSRPLCWQIAAILFLMGGSFLLYAVVPALRSGLHLLYIGVWPALSVITVNFALRHWRTPRREWADLLRLGLLLSCSVVTLLHFEGTLWQWVVCSVLGVGSALGLWRFRVTGFLLFVLSFLSAPLLF